MFAKGHQQVSQTDNKPNKSLQNYTSQNKNSYTSPIFSCKLQLYNRSKQRHSLKNLLKGLDKALHKVVS